MYCCRRLKDASRRIGDFDFHEDGANREGPLLKGHFLKTKVDLTRKQQWCRAHALRHAVRAQLSKEALIAT